MQTLLRALNMMLTSALALKLAVPFFKGFKKLHGNPASRATRHLYVHELGHERGLQYASVVAEPRKIGSAVALADEWAETVLRKLIGQVECNSRRFEHDGVIVRDRRHLAMRMRIRRVYSLGRAFFEALAERGAVFV
jgi:hypothetical protein